MFAITIIVTLVIVSILPTACALLFFFLETGFCSVAQVGHELEVLLPQPPKHWDGSHAPSHPTNFLNPQNIVYIYHVQQDV
jgi:hypothetical protein